MQTPPSINGSPFDEEISNTEFRISKNAEKVAIHTGSVYYRNMPTPITQTYTRVNITLPTQTLNRLSRVAQKRNRSRFIAEAISFYLKEKQRAAVRELLRDGARQRAERDRALAGEWFAFDL